MICDRVIFPPSEEFLKELSLCSSRICSVIEIQFSWGVSQDKKTIAKYQLPVRFTSSYLCLVIFGQSGIYHMGSQITKRKPNCISNCRSFCPADQKPFAFCANIDIERGTPLFKCFVFFWHFFSPRVRSIATTNVVFAAK